MTLMDRFISRPPQPAVLPTDNDDSFSILRSNVALRLFPFAKNKKPAQKKSVAGFTTRSLTPLVTTWGDQFIASTKQLARNGFYLSPGSSRSPFICGLMLRRACPVPCHDHQESRCSTLALCRLRHRLPALIRAAAPLVSFVVSHQTQAPLPLHADCSKTQRDR